MANEKDKQDMDARLKALEEQNAKLMALLEAKVEAPQAQGLSPDDFLAGITLAMKEATKGTERFANQSLPSNPDHLNPQFGPFEHPEGGLKHPKPALKREVWFAGARCRPSETTYAETVALNELSDSLGRGQRRLAHDGKWKAMVSDDDQQLLISVPMKTMDDRADLPSFLQIVQELTTGQRALDQGELAQEVAMLKLQLAQLTGAAA